MAVADPVLVGISERLLARARRRSLCGASTTTWVLVMSWIVVMTPCRMPIGFVNHLDDRREAVRRARRRGEQIDALPGRTGDR